MDAFGKAMKGLVNTAVHDFGLFWVITEKLLCSIASNVACNIESGAMKLHLGCL